MADAGLVGRVDERAALARRLTAVERGAGGVTLLEGEAGIGKTTLLDDVADRANGRGLAVRRATADELEGQRPFSLVTSLFPELADISSAVSVDDMRPSNVGTGLPVRLRLADALLSVVERQTSRSPLVLLADDLQWADADSLSILDSLARRAHTLGCWLVAALRTGPRAQGLDRLLEICLTNGAEELTLGPLSDAEVTELVAQLLGPGSSTVVGSQVQGAAGNPFLVVELVAVLSGGGSLSGVSRDRDRELVGEVPPAFRRAVLRRLRIDHPQGAPLIRTASILGQRFSLMELSRLTGEPVGRVATAISGAVEAGVLVDDGSALAFRHDLVRQALEADLSPSVRTALHREAADLLHELGAPALRVAPHLVLGAEPGDVSAVEWLADAATEVARQAPGAAADLLAHALELCPGSDPRRVRLGLARASYLVLAVRPAEAAALTAELLDRGLDGDDAARAITERVRALFLLGRPGEAVQLADAHPQAVSVRSAAEQVAETALARLFAADRAGAVRDAMTVLDEAAPDARVARALAGAVLAWTSGLVGRLDEALEHADASVAAMEADRSGNFARFHPHLFRSVVLDGRGEGPAAKEALRRGRALQGEQATVMDRAMADWLGCVLAFRSGEWDDAVAIGDGGLVLAQESGMRLGSLWPYAVAALVSLHRGDLVTAEQRLSAADEAAARGGQQLGLEWHAFAKALFVDQRGDPALALLMLGGLWDLAGGLGVPSTWTLIGPDLVRIAVQLGNVERASASVNGLEEFAAVARLPLYDAIAGHARAVMENDPDALLAAAHLYPVARPHERALGHGDAAIALAATGRTEEARVTAREAMVVFEQLGAVANGARLRAALRRHGVVMRVHSTRASASTGWDSLTRSELAVIDHLVDGLNNSEIADRLFVSRRTVESHLVHVYAKLGLSGRVQLANATVERRRGRRA